MVQKMLDALEVLPDGLVEGIGCGNVAVIINNAYFVDDNGNYSSFLVKVFYLVFYSFKLLHVDTQFVKFCSPGVPYVCGGIYLNWALPFAMPFEFLLPAELVFPVCPFPAPAACLEGSVQSAPSNCRCPHSLI